MSLFEKRRFLSASLTLLIVSLYCLSPISCAIDNVSLSTDDTEVSCSNDSDNNSELSCGEENNSEDKTNSSASATSTAKEESGYVCEDDDETGCKAMLLQDENKCKEVQFMQGCLQSCGVCDAEVASEAYGVRQFIHGMLSSKMIARSKKTQEYMNKIQAKERDDELKRNNGVTADDIDQNNVDKSKPCQNYHDKCLLLAAKGYCDSPDEEDVDDMIAECSPECQTCHLEASECARARRDRVPALEPGDLYTMFERIAAAATASDDDHYKQNKMNENEFNKEEQEWIEWMRQFQPKILSSPQHKSIIDSDYHKDDEYVEEIPPWVITLDNFLTPEEAQHFVHLGHRKRFKRSYYDLEEPGEDGSLSTTDESRTSQNTWCRWNTDEITKNVTRRIENVTGISHMYAESYQLLKYEEGELYEEHHDWSAAQLGEIEGPRILTFFLYLNDVEEGGGTRFTGLNNLTVTPKLGKALIWPSVKNDEPEQMDDWTWHEALPVIKGRKYGSNVWFHLYDCQANNPC